MPLFTFKVSGKESCLLCLARPKVPKCCNLCELFISWSLEVSTVDRPPPRSLVLSCLQGELDFLVPECLITCIFSSSYLLCETHTDPGNTVIVSSW